jgi:molecular chaperone DnaK (HSP70)
MNTITSRITVLPKGEPIFSYQATEISIVDEAAGPFFEIKQFPQVGDEQTIKFNVEEWPFIDNAIDKIIQEIKKLEEDIDLDKEVEFCRKIERERDMMAGALKRILSYQGRFDEEDPESIAAEALAAVEGGSDECR